MFLLGGAYLAGNDGAERNKHQEQQQLLHDDLLGGLVAALYRLPDDAAYLEGGAPPAGGRFPS